MELKVVILAAVFIVSATPALTPGPADPKCDPDFGSSNGKLTDHIQNKTKNKETGFEVPSSSMPRICAPWDDKNEEITRIHDFKWIHKLVIVVVVILLLGGAIFVLATYKRDTPFQCNL